MKTSRSYPYANFEDWKCIVTSDRLQDAKVHAHLYKLQLQQYKQIAMIGRSATQ